MTKYYNYDEIRRYDGSIQVPFLQKFYKRRRVSSCYVSRSLHPPPLFISGVLFLCCPEFTPTSGFHMRCTISMLSGVYTHLRFSYSVRRALSMLSGVYSHLRFFKKVYVGQCYGSGSKWDPSLNGLLDPELYLKCGSGSRVKNKQTSGKQWL